MNFFEFLSRTSPYVSGTKNLLFDKNPLVFHVHPTHKEEIFSLFSFRTGGEESMLDYSFFYYNSFLEPYQVVASEQPGKCALALWEKAKSM